YCQKWCKGKLLNQNDFVTLLSGITISTRSYPPLLIKISNPLNPSIDLYLHALQRSEGILRAKTMGLSLHSNYLTATFQPTLGNDYPIEIRFEYLTQPILKLITRSTGAEDVKTSRQSSSQVELENTKVLLYSFESQYPPSAEPSEISPLFVSVKTLKRACKSLIASLISNIAQEIKIDRFNYQSILSRVVDSTRRTLGVLCSYINNGNLDDDEIQNPTTDPNDVVLIRNPVEEVYNVIWVNDSDEEDDIVPMRMPN
ncbi:unnamed protein product, partial [Allacma fusca]